MTQTQSIAEGDRIYATEMINYRDGDYIRPGVEGTVIELTGHDDIDLMIEWDAGFVGGACSGCVSLVS